MSPFPTFRPNLEMLGGNAKDIAILQELADMQMELARMVSREISEEEAAQPGFQARRMSEQRAIFARLTRGIRDAIKLRDRIAGGIIPPDPEVDGDVDDDPRHAAITDYFETILSSLGEDTDREELEEQIEELVTDELEDDTEQAMSGADIVMTICAELDLPCDPDKMPDELFSRPRGHTTLSELEELVASMQAKKR